MPSAALYWQFRWALLQKPQNRKEMRSVQHDVLPVSSKQGLISNIHNIQHVTPHDYPLPSKVSTASSVSILPCPAPGKWSITKC